jgi:hypothetical protein
MERFKANELARKIGLIPYGNRIKNSIFVSELESQGGYEKFENAIKLFLRKYESKIPTLTTKIGFGDFKKYSKLRDFSHAVGLFKDYYGIGRNATKQWDLAKMDECSAANIGRKVSFVVGILNRHLDEIALKTMLSDN